MHLQSWSRLSVTVNRSRVGRLSRCIQRAEQVGTFRTFAMKRRLEADEGSSSSIFLSSSYRKCVIGIVAALSDVVHTSRVLGQIIHAAVFGDTTASGTGVPFFLGSWSDWFPAAELRLSEIDSQVGMDVSGILVHISSYAAHAVKMHEVQPAASISCLLTHCHVTLQWSLQIWK